MMWFFDTCCHSGLDSLESVEHLGATYLVGKDLEMSNSGLDSLERVQHLLPRQQVPAI